jgi:hypothetical protein
MVYGATSGKESGLEEREQARGWHIGPVCYKTDEREEISRVILSIQKYKAIPMSARGPKTP